MDRSQIILLSFAALIIGYQAIKGWRLGLVRQIVRFGALAAAYATAFFAGGYAVPFLRPLGYPDLVLRCLGGAALGLVAYLFICLIGGILFKRTAHQDVGLVWFVYGTTGALMGMVFGLVVVLFFADVVRLLGNIAVAKTALTAMPAKPGHAADALANPKLESPVNSTLIALKQTLESNLPGEVLQTIDPVPKKVYAIAAKVGRVGSDPDAAVRFLSFPGARELAERPEVQALRDDPEILRTVRDGHFLLLLKNEKIVKAANDPKIAAMIQKFDLEKALDHALKK